MVLSKFLKFWFPVIGYSGIIFYVSSLPDLQAPVPGWNVDKVIHVLEYIPFGYLLARALAQEQDYRFTGKLIVWVTIFTLLYGLSDEFHQLFVIGRSSSLWDAVADTIGGHLGVWTLVVHSRRSHFEAKI